MTASLYQTSRGKNIPIAACLLPLELLNDSNKSFKREYLPDDILLRMMPQIIEGKNQASSPPQIPSLYLVNELKMKQEIKNAIANFDKSVKKIKNVVKIVYLKSGNNLSVWTFLKKFDRGSLYKIYNIEQQFIEKHKTISFDFSSFFSPSRPIPANFKEADSWIS
jgi:hypothetical protein